MPDIKVAIIGCGMIADAHVKEINKIEDTGIVAVCDKEPMMAEQLAERYDIPAFFSDFGELVDRYTPDVVHILTPPATHLPLGLAALEAGCHVLMEKPFTTTGAEAETLVNRAASLGKEIIVNHFHNFSPPALRLRDMVSNGELGEILHLEGFYSYGMQSPVARVLISDRHSWIHKLPGKIIHNNIDHLLCKFIEFMPDEALQVRAHAKRLGEEARRSSHSFIHDELRAFITGDKVTAYATFSANIQPFRHTMTVYGSLATTHIDYESRTMITSPASSLPGPFGKLAVPFLLGKRFFREGVGNVIRFGKSDFHFYAGAHNLFKEFYRCIREGTPAPLPHRHMIRVASIMDDIFNQTSASDLPYHRQSMEKQSIPGLSTMGQVRPN